MERAPGEAAGNATILAQNCTAPSCPKEGGASDARLAVYLVTAAAFLACAGLAVWWRRRAWRGRTRRFEAGAGPARSPPKTPSGPGRPGTRRAAAGPEPDPDRRGDASAYYENVMILTAPGHGDHGDRGDRARRVKSERGREEVYELPAGLADEGSVYDNDAPNPIYCNHPMWDHPVQDDTYVFPDQRFE